MKKIKFCLSIILVICVVNFSSSCAKAKSKVKLSSKKISVSAGKSKNLKLNGTNKKVKFKITSGKKKVKLKRKSSNCVKITGLKKGKAKIKATVNKKSYICSVTVKTQKRSSKMQIKINGKKFTAALNNSKAAKELREKLPIKLNMEDLNGNEKYYYFFDSFSGTAKKFSTINPGDLMIYGGDCLVLFYDKIENSPYRYIKIGSVKDTKGLAKALGSGNVTIEFTR